MAMRSALCRLSVTRSMQSTRGATRYFSDDKGRILSEEERAAENVYIQKMEREKLEKLKQKAEKEKLEKEKESADKHTEKYMWMGGKGSGHTIIRYKVDGIFSC
ncbi:putative F1F0-ATPase inhibitor protein [Melia azedarach]|uniref:F1F0-ATPase inhibitor protein n=1 Tax=Melia azedarach TaxID=155640 RepID=A0ACC1YBV2_MELAZ|nr:putative F1F0-ATPase inhibitor protein [Melia azedarach]